MKGKTLLFLVTEDWYFWSHRLPLARAARDAGYKVIVATRVIDFGQRIQAEGFRLIPISMVRSSRNPLRELVALAEITGLYLNLRPDVVHHVAVKPVLYGSIAARIAGIPAIVNALAGLGFIFISKTAATGLLRSLVIHAYRFAFSRDNTRVIFQNPDDLGTFVDRGIVPREKTTLIRSSGVDLDLFSVHPEPKGDPLCVLPARMLWDKGVGEFVEAARLLRKDGIKARFVLVGGEDGENPAAIARDQLEFWQKEGVVEWWGRRDDMPAVLAESHLVCLPSYREGLPKSLIEAAACGRPIVATDVPGCREVVHADENGLLVPPRDAVSLAKSLKRLIKDGALRGRMGKRSRELAEDFSQDIVIEKTLAAYAELLS